jgi:hypothetical protein
MSHDTTRERHDPAITSGLPRRLLNEHEVAHITGRAVSTLQKQRLTGTGIRFVKVGRQVKYRLEDVEDFLAALTPQSSTSDRRAA